MSAVNACGNVSGNTITVYGKIPVTPAPITGLANVCVPSVGNYSTAGSTGAASYTWSVTGNATVSGNGTNATVNYASNFTTGTLSVTSINTCGNSYAKTLVIKKIAYSGLLSRVDINNAEETESTFFNIYPNPTTGLLSVISCQTTHNQQPTTE